MPELRASVFVPAMAVLGLLVAACNQGGAIVTPTPAIPITPPATSPAMIPTQTPTTNPPSAPTQGGQITGMLKLIQGSDGMTMATDAAGALHVATATTVDASGVLKVLYGTCSAACTNSASWRSVAFGPTSAGHVPTIALTADGRPRIAYYVATGDLPGLHYLECNAACTGAASWTDVPVSNALSSIPWPRPRLPFAVSPSGSVAFPYDDASGLQLLFCAANCAGGGQWSVVPIGGQFVVPESAAFGADESLQVMARQRVVDTETLVFVDCPSACASAQSWAANVSLWSSGGEIEALIARTAGGGTRVTVYGDYFGTPQVERVLAYIGCDAACREPTSWQTPILLPVAAGAADVGYDTLLDPSGNPLIAYAGEDSASVARCSAECTTTSGPWQITPALAVADLDAAFAITVPAECLSASWSLYTGPTLALVAAQPITAVTASSKAFGGQCGNGSTAIEVSSFVSFLP